MRAFAKFIEEINNESRLTSCTSAHRRGEGLERGDIDRAHAFFTGVAGTRLRTLLEASREAQNAVSEKLSGQVLAALYELLRGLHCAAPAQIEAIAASHIISMKACSPA
jgi:hypothetical protein